MLAGPTMAVGKVNVRINPGSISPLPGSTSTPLGLLSKFSVSAEREVHARRQNRMINANFIVAGEKVASGAGHRHQHRPCGQAALRIARALTGLRLIPELRAIESENE